MLTKHELELTLAYRTLTSGWPAKMAQSRTLQAVISSLRPQQVQRLREAKTFAEVMELVAQLKGGDPSTLG